MNATWRNRAACRGIDPDLFFPVTDEEADPAKAICDVCPVREACLSSRSPPASAKASGVAAPSGSAAASSGSAARRRSAYERVIPSMWTVGFGVQFVEAQMGVKAQRTLVFRADTQMHAG